MKSSKRLLALAVAAACAPMSVYATNGMLLEGYGPIATAMGGASMAYDNGTAGVANNPATIGMMSDDSSRLDVAWGFLGPDVSVTVPVSAGGSGNKAKSSADAFNMPAVGWVKKNNQMSYGFGVFAQGGMGTEYSATSDVALGSGDKVRSEVGVARLIVPLAYNINDKLTLGGSLDYVRARMDLKMAVPTSAMNGLVTGYDSGWSGVVGGMGSYNWARFDFSDNSDYDGAAKGDGFAYKLGATYQVSPELSVGASYHSETALSDLSGGATLSAGNTGSAAAASFAGTIKVRDFQFPAEYGVGLSYQPNDAWQVVADVKSVQWAAVMKKFKMSFISPTMGALNVAMNQEWKDQTVVQLGVGYKVNNAFTLRAGYNGANNPVPNQWVNYLFPAVVETHYTAGFGYAFDKASDINFSMTYAPEVKVIGTGTVGTGNGSQIITHSQTNWQLMYSHRF